MIDDVTVRLAAALAEVAQRPAAAAALATHVGAASLLILVDDPIVGAMLPAPGFPPTLPGGPSWRALLRQVRADGLHEGEVTFPTADTSAPVIAYTASGVALVFIGRASKPPASDAIDRIAAIMPLLAAVFQNEHAALVARGELAAAQNHAREVEALARALDGARSEVERTLLVLEERTRALEEERRRAEAATRAKDEFLAMLGHELRNPLSPIVTALQLMRLKNHASREQDVIERQVASLMQLVDDLLDVSRITRGKIDLRKRRLDLAEVAARAIEMASPVLEKKQQVLDVDVPARTLIVDGDPTRLAQVLANLLTNAAKYSDTDSRITFSASADDRHVRISVKDEGIGIAADMLTRVFDLFVQNSQSLDRSQGGLGLGLAIVRSLVSLHGGTVTAHSEGLGQGSEFIVELPRVLGEVPAPKPERRDSVLGLRRTERHPQRVLVVDDNADAVELISEALTTMGYTVRAAADGPAGLEAAESFTPEVALLDIGLPVMDGYELAARLRERFGPALRLVAITGYGQQADRLQSRDVGFDAHLVKPITLEDLHGVLDTFATAHQ